MAKRQTGLEWDIDGLKAAVKDLEREKEELRQYWDSIDGLRRTAAQNWQSPAGTDYQSRMSGELAVLKNLLRQLEKHIEAMREVISGCYEKCESEVRADVRALRGKIR